MISVIIPAYNAAMTIDKCLDSLLAQTYTDYEIIVVNDGSLDYTASIIKAKSCSRIVLINQPNGGVSAARNRGLLEAKGEYISFVDADDYVAREYLEVLSQAILECDIVMGRCTEVVNNQYEVRENSSVDIAIDELKSNLCRYIRDGYVCSPWFKLFKSSIIKERGIKFNTNVKYGEDFLFVMEYLSNVSSIKLIDNSLYYYVRWEGTCSTGYRPNITEEYQLLSDAVAAFLGNDHKGQAISYKQRVMKESLIMIYSYYKAGNLTKAEFKSKFKQISSCIRGINTGFKGGLVDKVFYTSVKNGWLALSKLMLMINSR